MIGEEHTGFTGSDDRDIHQFPGGVYRGIAGAPDHGGLAAIALCLAGKAHDFITGQLAVIAGFDGAGAALTAVDPEIRGGECLLPQNVDASFYHFVRHGQDRNDNS